MVNFDIIFDYVLNDKEVIIDLEPQSYEPEYINQKRSIYYLGREMSKEKGKYFTNKDYDSIRKVYSIWIYLNPNVDQRDSIIIAKFNPEIVYGNPIIIKKNYDLMELIEINVKEKSENELIRFLGMLFSSDIKVEDKLKIMQEEFNFKIEGKLEKEVKKMCNYSQVFKERGIKQGIVETKVNDLKNLMINLNLSENEAMNALSIPNEERDKYIKLLSN